MLGQARLVRGATQQGEAFLGGVERLGDQRLAVAIDARDLSLELLAARAEICDVRLREALEVLRLGLDELAGEQALQHLEARLGREAAHRAHRRGASVVEPVELRRAPA